MPVCGRRYSVSTTAKSSHDARCAYVQPLAHDNRCCCRGADPLYSVLHDDTVNLHCLVLLSAWRRRRRRRTRARAATPGDELSTSSTSRFVDVAVLFGCHMLRRWWKLYRRRRRCDIRASWPSGSRPQSPSPWIFGVAGPECGP